MEQIRFLCGMEGVTLSGRIRNIPKDREIANDIGE
jgi:hypothetical protein